MTKITGRPPKQIKQERNIGFFVTEREYFIIQQKVKEANVTVSDYMRQAAIRGEVRPRWTAEERDLFRRLIGMSNDLNELVRQARKEGAASAMLYFTGYRDRLDAIINCFSHEE
jgi:hypothetical protein